MVPTVPVRFLAKRLFALVISMAYQCVTVALRAISRGNEARSIVLTYHDVPEASLGRFERQLRHLEKTAVTCFADELDASGGRVRVAVTFDDAFQRALTRVLPALARHRIPATVFVPTGYMGRAPGWQSDDGSTASAGPVASAAMLGSFDRNAVRIGSHTVWHRRLDELSDGELQAELDQSMAALETVTGQPIRLLSLPYGSCSSRVLEAAVRTGYERVFANIPLSSTQSSFVLGRINVSPEDWWLEYCLKVRGAYQWMAYAVPLKRCLAGGSILLRSRA